MKRSFLAALGLEKDVIDQIMAEHGNTVEYIKEKAKEDAEKQIEKLNGKIGILQEKLDKIPEPDVSADDWEAKYEALKAKYDAFKTAHSDDMAAKQKELNDYKLAVENEKTISTKKTLLHKQLAADGANPATIGLLELAFNIDAIELEGETIKNWDDVSKPIKEQHAGLFGSTITEGVHAANPPSANGVLNPFAKDTYSLQAQTDLYRKNPDLARKMAANVGVKLL